MSADDKTKASTHPDDSSKWEFYAGGHGDNAQWVQGDVDKAVPLVTWNNHTGTACLARTRKCNRM